MTFVRRAQNRARARNAGATVSVPSDQGVVRVPTSVIPELPTKPSKAYVAAVITLLGLLGIHLTTGTAQALVMVGQLLLVIYGVWRTRNRVVATRRGMGDFL